MTATAIPKHYQSFGLGPLIKEVKGYQVFATLPGIRQAQSYAVEALLGGASSVQAYAALVNPASVTAANSYALHYVNNQMMESKGYVLLTSIYPPYEDLSVEFPFSERRFPTYVSFGSSGGPGFKTSIFTVDSGIAQANAEWERIRARYTIEFENVPEDEIEEVENFFYSMRGKAIGFRYKDWNDFNIVNQNIILGDGTTRTFQLFKRYRSGANVFDRIIRKPVAGTVSSIYLDGIEQILNREFFVNYSNGMITFVTPPAAGQVGRINYVEFDVPVRFDTDELMVSSEDFNQYSISNLDMIEILA
jgi:uncharacterized protein (TIGR02217 family)